MKTILPDILLRYRLFWVFSGVFPLSAFAVLMMVVFTEQQEDSIARLLREASNNSALVVEQAISHQIALLEGLSTSRDLDDLRFDAFSAVGKRLWALHPEWRTVILTDEKKPIVNLFFPLGKPMPPLRDPRSLREVWESKKPFVGDLANGYVAIRVPVIRNGKVIFTLVAPTDPRYFRDALQASSRTKSWRYVIVGGDNVVISASPQIGIQTGNRFTDPSGSGRGRAVFHASVRAAPPVLISPSGWRIYVFSPSNAIETPFTIKRLAVYAAGGTAAVATVLLVLALGSAWSERQETVRLHREIEDRRLAEKTLQESEQRFRSVLDNTRDFIFRRNLKTGSYEYASPSAERVMGLTADEFLTMGFEGVRPLIDTADMPVVENALSLVETEGKAEVEFRIQTTSGELRWLSNHMSLVVDNTGKPLFRDSIIRDITEKKVAGEKLAKSQAHLLAIMNSTDDMIWSVEPESFALIAWNRALDESLLKECGVRARVGVRLDELRPEGSDSAWLFDDFYRRSLAEAPLTVEHSTSPAGRILQLSFNLLRQDGQVFGISVFSRDITEKRRLEEQLRQAQKMEAVGTLAGGVAHDFNNMLSVILGYSELVMRVVEKGSELYAGIEQIHRAASRSAEITGQLLAFARKQTISPRTIDLNETVEGLLKMLRRLIGESIDLAWLPGKGLWPVTMDPSQIDQILANLIVNARDAIVDTGKISIETNNVSLDEEYCASHAGFVPGDFAVIAVSDDGCGMDNETASKIFEPFFTTKKPGEGTGLGLSTVYGIVKQNNGLINVYSEPGKGTTFRIYLPRQSKGRIEEESRDEKGVATGHGETILVVEDEASILTLARRSLEGLEYVVLTADRPEKALEVAANHQGPIHLLVTDVVMPGMNGKELCEELRKSRPGLKCLFMSGYTADAIAHRGVLDKGVHFLQKPFALRDLAAKVRGAIDR